MSLLKEISKTVSHLRLQ